MSNKEIGERIRKLRERQNCTRDDLAEKINISSKFLYEIETGKKDFPPKLCIKFPEHFP